MEGESSASGVILITCFLLLPHILTLVCFILLHSTQNLSPKVKEGTSVLC